MRTRRLFSAALILSWVGLAASCGGDEAISKEDFVTKANAKCTTLNETLDGPESALGGQPTEEQVTAFITDVLVPELGKTVKSIRDLGFPKGDEALLDGLMDETEVILDSIADDPASILEAEQSPFTSVNERLTEYGLTVCGSDA